MNQRCQTQSDAQNAGLISSTANSFRMRADDTTFFNPGYLALVTNPLIFAHRYGVAAERDETPSESSPRQPTPTTSLYLTSTTCRKDVALGPPSGKFEDKCSKISQGEVDILEGVNDQSFNQTAALLLDPGCSIPGSGVPQFGSVSNSLTANTPHSDCHFQNNSWHGLQRL